MLKKIISIALSVVMLSCTAVVLSSCSGNKNTADAGTDYNLTKNIKDGVILQCFAWDFKTIENSLEDIAAAGYSAVQTSPINECYEGENGGMSLYSDGEGKWYYHYQPTDFTIGNYQLGTRDEFKSMCKKAHKLGIKVVVDVIANHTTPTISAINNNLIKAVGDLNNLYHANNTKGDITDYGNRLQCTTYKMGGLPDINTENKAFQDYFIKYINDCIDCGADGFRYDTAKHIGLPDDPKDPKSKKNNFWDRVTTEIHKAKSTFLYGEVLQGNGDRIDDYIKKIGACAASAYGGTVRNAIMTNSLDSENLLDLRLVGSNNGVTWVESHDNYINDGNWAAMGDEDVLTGWAIIAARGTGTPLFFDRPYGSSMDDQWGSMNRIGASGDMFYKDKRVAALNFFRNAMVGEKEKFINPEEDLTALEICRGKKGAVIVNTKDKLDVNFKTDLADGTYVDRVDGKTEYEVKNGKITCKKAIPEYSVVVLYNEGYEQYAKPALVKVDDKTEFALDKDALSVKLEAKNAALSTYSINDKKDITYKNGDKVTVKAKDCVDGVVTLTLKGKSSAGQNTYMKYYFTDRNSDDEGEPVIVKKGSKVTFKKPAGWGDNLFAYIYDKSNKNEGEWPGSEMKKLSGDKYEYTCRGDWENAFIIFNDGENQFPGQNEPGFPLEADKEYSVG